jgi:hypothetical protein
MAAYNKRGYSLEQNEEGYFELFDPAIGYDCTFIDLKEGIEAIDELIWHNTLLCVRMDEIEEEEKFPFLFGGNDA